MLQTFSDLFFFGASVEKAGHCSDFSFFSIFQWNVHSSFALFTEIFVLPDFYSLPFRENQGYKNTKGSPYDKIGQKIKIAPSSFTQSFAPQRRTEATLGCARLDHGFFSEPCYWYRITFQFSCACVGWKIAILMPKIKIFLFHRNLCICTEKRSCAVHSQTHTKPIIAEKI